MNVTGLETSQRSRRQQPLVKKLLFAAAASIAFFAALEIILWLAGVQRAIERQDPSQGFSGLVSVFDRDGDVYRTRKMLHGVTFNDQSFSASKPSHGLRIFCLGGSSSFGFPFGANWAFTAILGDALAEAHPELEVEAVNASGISYAMHRLRIVAHEIARYEPDIIIVYSGHNEFVEPAFYEEFRKQPRAHDRLDYTLAYWRLYSLGSSFLQRPNTEAASSEERFQMTVRRIQDVVYSDEKKQEIVAEFGNGLREIVRVANRCGAKVVLATVPCNERDWRPESSVIDKGLTQDQRLQWEVSLRTARRRLKARQFQAATDDLQQLLRISPRHADTHYLLGKALEGLEQWQEARAAYARACDYDASPNRRVAAINQAVRQVAEQEGALLVDVQKIYEGLSEHDLVGFNLIEDYVHPTLEGHQIIAWNMWQALEREGWVGKPATPDKSLLVRVMQQRPKEAATQNGNWFYNQGLILENQGRLTQAAAKYEQALQRMPNHVAARLNLGAILAEKGNLEGAIQHFRTVLDFDSQNADAHINMSSALRAQGKRDEAIKHYRSALGKNRDVRAHTGLGSVLRKQGKLDEAVNHFRAAISLGSEQRDPSLTEAHNNLALILQEQGKLDEAAAHFQKALAIDPYLVPTYTNLGIVRSKQGQPDKAIAHYRDALRLQPDNLRALKRLIAALNRQGRLTDAVQPLQRAVAMNANLVEMKFNLGLALLASDRFDEAAGHLSAAARQSQKCAAKLRELADTAAANRNGNARQRKVARLLAEITPE